MSRSTYAMFTKLHRLGVEEISYKTAYFKATHPIAKRSKNILPVILCTAIGTTVLSKNETEHSIFFASLS